MAADADQVPAAAAARLARLTGTPGRTSLVTAASAAGLASVGLAPVSEVMGAVGRRIAWLGMAGAGLSYRPQTVVAGHGRSPGAGYRPYVDALHNGFRTALSRLAAEVAAVRADGAVGIRVTVTERDDGFYEFVAAGTAVRAETSQRSGTPFLSDLSGADVAKLMGYGWVPVTIAVGISVATRVGENPRLAAGVGPLASYEITGYSDMMTRARVDARRRFEREVRACGADGAIVSTLTAHLRTLERDAPRAAEAHIIGTAIARFAATPPVRPTRPGVLPLRRAGERGGR